MKAAPISECIDCILHGGCEFLRYSNGIYIPGPKCPWPDVPDVKNFLDKPGYYFACAAFVEALRRVK